MPNTLILIDDHYVEISKISCIGPVKADLIYLWRDGETSHQTYSFLIIVDGYRFQVTKDTEEAAEEERRSIVNWLDNAGLEIIE